MQTKTNFHMKGFARELALKKRHKTIRKWPILDCEIELSEFSNGEPKTFRDIKIRTRDFQILQFRASKDVTLAHQNVEVHLITVSKVKTLGAVPQKDQGSRS